ncbi:hypothetical protein QGN23_03695 [Chryseobacterium gotjawalense]|uniref:Uncharacterized protein n=1 Tax=Chryseobacterium gotjawalense TaxID=3042315 RepID=A0ABY8RH76_9FLAO|nr:hypothetical protein [Chryseobacterium sp. wdc7]WHF52389.1 hypothetical protein QGN23_03695 [Chryseobacterium sp. wdc7]
MEIILLSISFLTLHYPLGLFTDNVRRYERFKQYNKDGAFGDYCRENGIGVGTIISDNNPFTKLPIYFLAVLSGFVLSYFPLQELLPWKWYFLIPLNIVIAKSSSLLAFFIMGQMKIYSIRKLNITSIISIIFGIALFLYVKFM